MSTDTPTPERVTLTDEEWTELHGLATVEGLSGPSSRECAEEWLAAREQALREEIAARVQAAVDLHAQHGHREIVAAMGVLPDLIRGGSR